MKTKIETKEIQRTETITETTYVAFDGTEFDKENDCFDLNRAMPKNYKVDYEKGRSIARARYQYAQNRRSRENVGQADYVSEEPRQPEFIETTIVESSDDSYDNEM